VHTPSTPDEEANLLESVRLGREVSTLTLTPDWKTTTLAKPRFH
jgi:hypothetical protein